MRKMFFLFYLLTTTMISWSENKKDIQYIYNSQGKVEKSIRLLGSDLERITSFDYDQDGRLSRITWPNKVSLYYEYDGNDHLHLLYSSDGSVNYHVECNEEGYVTLCIDLNTGGYLKRILTSQNQLLEEIFPSGEIIRYAYGDMGRLTEVGLSDFGSVQYDYKDSNLCKVTRVASSGEVLYSHEYLWDQSSQHIIKESLIGDLGVVSYAASDNHLKMVSPFADYTLKVDAEKGISEVYFNGIKQDLLIDNYNALENELNELLQFQDVLCRYDLNGNLISKQTPIDSYFFSYDGLNRLICVRSENYDVRFSYDVFGRRLSKEIFFKGERLKEIYLYQQEEEVVVIDNTHNLAALRILGAPVYKQLTRAISFETPKGTYAPIYDHAHHVRKLINIATYEISDYTALDFFAKNLSELKPIIPWIYSTKHYDAETNLIYYGHRYYDASIKRWTTVDPLGAVDSHNLYLFAHNNPLNYCDPDGRFVVVVPLIGFSIKAVITATAYASAAGAAAWTTYKIDKAVKEKEEAKRYEKYKENQKKQAREENILRERALQRTRERANQYNKNTDVYAPDRPLPRDERSKEPVPETDAPHTELGTRGGSYPQAREFDKNGMPVKDIDFTDHGRPNIHLNPHEHPYENNPTGGTPRRGDPRPLDGWEY